MEKDVEIGIFGGTGIYDSGLLENAQEVDIDTPYGKPSDTITVGIFKGRKIAFLPRHGKKHTIPPHKINYTCFLVYCKSRINICCFSI